MNIQVITTVKGVEALAKKLQGVTKLGYDLEFSPLNPHDNSRIFMASLAANGTAYVIDFTLVSPASMKALEPILTSKQVVKIAHNMSIDWKHSLHHFGFKLQNVYCTQVAEEVLTAGLEVESIKYTDHDGKERSSSFSLAALLWRRFRITLAKETRNVFINYDGSPFTKEAYEYAGKDTLYLEEIYNQQQAEIREKSLQRVIGLEMRLLPFVAQMEYNGVPFNIEKCKEGVPVVDSIIARMQHWLQDMFISQGAGDNITFDDDGYSCVKLTSWQQVLRAFNAIGIDVEKTDKDALKEWDFRHGLKWNEKFKEDTVWLDDETEDFDIAFACAALRHYAVIKALEKFKGTYLMGLQERYHAPTGKVYPSFRQMGARATGRFSSNNPNFQNLIKADNLKAIGLGEYDVRGMCYAPPGYKLIISDYEGIELVLLAIISGDADLQNAILSDDTHKVVTAMIAKSFGFNELPEGYKKKIPFKAFRDVAKTKTYARIYGSGVPNLHRKLSIPIAQAGYRLERYHVQSWFDGWAVQFQKAAHALEIAANQAVTQGYVETVLGRRRQWDLETFKEDPYKKFGAMRQGANSQIQGSAADLMKLAFVRVGERIDNKQAWMLMQVHDEMVLLARDEYVDECCEIVGTQMVRAGELLWPDAPKGLIKAEPKVSTIYDK